MMGIPNICQAGIPTVPRFTPLWEYPQVTKLATILPARISARLAATGKSMRAVSIEIGAHAGYVRDLLDPERFNVPSAERLRALAIALETTTDFLMGSVDDPVPVHSEVGVADRMFEWRGPPRSEEPGIPLVGTGDCADIEFCDESGALVAVERSSFDPEYFVRMISRPPALRGMQGLYAIYFHGESMLHRFEPGDVGIVDPSRPPAPGDYVLVQLNNGESDDVVSVLVKRLVRATSRELVLEQFNPAIIFAVPRSRVSRFHRIMPQTDLLLG